MIQCWPNRTPHFPVAVTDWFRIVQLAQHWHLRVIPDAWTETLGKEALSFQLGYHTLCYDSGRGYEEERQPRGKQGQTMHNEKFLRALSEHLNSTAPQVFLLLDLQLYGKKFPFLFKPDCVRDQSEARVLTNTPVSTRRAPTVSTVY